MIKKWLWLDPSGRKRWSRQRSSWIDLLQGNSVTATSRSGGRSRTEQIPADCPLGEVAVADQGTTTTSALPTTPPVTCGATSPASAIMSQRPRPVKVTKPGVRMLSTVAMVSSLEAHVNGTPGIGLPRAS